MVISMSGEMVGSVSEERYQELVTVARDLVDQESRIQFTLGDLALEIEPMRARGGRSSLEPNDFVSVALERFADDIVVSLNTIRSYRWVSSRWPSTRRVAGVSHTIHSILANIHDEDERFEVILDPPADARTGEKRWGLDAARRAVGHRVDRPESPQEKVERILDLAREDSVAAQVTQDFLRRPAIASKVMEDRTSRHIVNQVQYERARETVQSPRPTSPVAKIQQTMQFVDVVGVCAAFVAGAGRVIPTLQGHVFSESEQAIIHQNLARIRATADWLESAVESGAADIDEAYAQLLQGD